MKKMSFFPTIQNCLIQGLFWASYSSVIVFASMFLANRGLSNAQIGYVIAGGSALSAVLQPIVGAFADRSKKMILRRLIILFSLSIIAFCFGLFFVKDNRIVIAILYGLIIMSLQVITPLTYSLSLFFSDKGVRINFGISRGIGSLAYAGLSALLGVLATKMGDMVIVWSLVILYSLLIFAVISFRFKGVSEEVSEDRPKGESRSLIKFAKEYKRFVMVLIGTSLLFISYNFLCNYNYQIFSYLGFGSEEVGFAVSLAAALELPTLFLLSWLNKKFNSGFLYKVSAAFIFFKVLLMYLAKDLPMIYIAMCTQIFGFALYAGISVYYVDHTLSKENLAFGQSLMTMTVTVGTVLGGLIGGKLLDMTSVPIMLFVAVLIALVGMTVICVFTEKGKKYSK